MSAGTISMGLDGFLLADIPDDWSEGLALLPMSKWTKSRIIEEAERSGVGEKVILTCSYLLPSSFTPADNVIVLPCLAMLPPELWMQTSTLPSQMAIIPYLSTV